MPKKALSELSIDPLNIRSDLGTEMELLRLGHSMLIHQETPLVVNSLGMIKSGHRRFAAAKMVGITHLDCIIDDSDGGTASKLAEVMHRADISPYDKAVGIQKTLDENPGMTRKELAETVIHQDAAQVTRYLKIFDCDPLVIEAARLGQISVTDWVAIKDSPDQLATLNVKLGGVQKQSNKKSATVKVDKLKLALQTGAVVTVAAESVSLEDVSEILSELGKQVKKAIGQGLDAKTFQAVMSDMAGR